MKTRHRNYEISHSYANNRKRLKNVCNGLYESRYTLCNGINIHYMTSDNILYHIGRVKNIYDRAVECSRLREAFTEKHIPLRKRNIGHAKQVEHINTLSQKCYGEYIRLQNVLRQ